MPSVTDDFQMPIMYQDLRNSNMGMLHGFGMFNTNFLGGIRMPRELTNDEFVLKNRRAKELSTLKKAGLAIAALASAVVLKNRGAFTWVSKKTSGVTGWVKGLFKSKKPTP